MENNIENSVKISTGKKSNNLIIAIVIIILAIIAIIILKINNQKIQPEPQSLSQSDIELNQAITSDTTKSINDNLNSINLDDTSDADLISVDQELGKL